MNVDTYDKKLISALDCDATAHLGQLAKELKKSKQFVQYRMQRLEEAGIITGYHAIIDMSKLGYFTFRVYFDVQQMTESQKDDFVAYVSDKLEQVWTITTMHDKWDFALFLGVQTIDEFHVIWDGLMQQFKHQIKRYNVAVYAPIHNFNRKFLVGKDYQNIERVYGSGSKTDLSDVDIAILQEYAKQVRIPAQRLAKKIGVSADTVRKKIKQLEQTHIAGYKIGLNVDGLGYTSYRVDLELLHATRNKELFAFCRLHANIYQVNKSIGGADFEMQVIVKNTAELFALIDEIKTTFYDVVNDVNYFGFSTFHKLTYIPD